MFGFMRRRSYPTRVEQLVSILVDEPATSPGEVFRRCQAADDLAAIGWEANASVPALLRQLVIPVTVDCGLALRVAVAAAIWKISHRYDVSFPFLVWALKDEYWGVAPKAIEILTEIGSADAVPDLIWLAERRITNGPFYFEDERYKTRTSIPFLASVAIALGRCAQGKVDGRSYSSEARVTLTKLAAYGDEQVRLSAIKALSSLNGET